MLFAPSARCRITPCTPGLFDAFFADCWQRGDPTPDLPSERLGIQVFTFQVGAIGPRFDSH